MAPAVFKTVGRAWRGGRFDSCLFRMSIVSRARPPALGRLLERADIAAKVALLSRPLVLRVLRELVAEFREGAGSGDPGRGPSPGAGTPDPRLAEEELAREALVRLGTLARRRIRPVLNGTGVLLHTNLGRSPLGEELWEEARAANSGYSSVELDLESGERGGRGGLVPLLAAELAGAESALVLNNNAGALLLALRSLASGREVLVSRGEQVQIGGGFRIPEILALSGATLVEVGTTNVTGVEDYLRALGPNTACVLVVHSSNFAIRGFTSKPELAELAAALPEGLPLLVDQGSGCIRPGQAGERTVASLVAAGADLVCFSADKLLGGPQAGIAAGRRDLVEAMAKDPLARALRPGKTILSLLERRLVRALNGESGAGVPPEPERIEAFARELLGLLPPGSFELLPSRGTTGGGSAPDESFPSFALASRGGWLARLGGADAAAALLRAGEPALLPLIREGRLLVDLAALIGEGAEAPAGVLAALVARAGASRGEGAAMERRGRGEA